MQKRESILKLPMKNEKNLPQLSLMQMDRLKMYNDSFSKIINNVLLRSKKLFSSYLIWVMILENEIALVVAEDKSVYLDSNGHNVQEWNQAGSIDLLFSEA